MTTDATVLDAMKEDGRNRSFLAEKQKNDRSVVLAAVEQNGYALEYASATLRNDRDIVLAAVKQNGFAIQFASETLRNDRDVVLAAVEQNGFVLRVVSATLQHDRDVVLAAVEQNGFALHFASETLQHDRGVVLAAVKQNGVALEYASATLRNDRAVALAAVDHNGFALGVAPATLQGVALEYASAPLRNDRDLVLAAVEQNGYALAYASSGLKADRAVVLAAMRKAPRMFLFAITTRGEYDEQSLLFRDRNLWLEWCRSGPSECKERTPPMDPHLWSEIFAAAKSRLASRDSDQQLVCNITDIAFEPLLTPLVAGGASESPSIRIHTVYCLNGQQEVWLGLSPETTVAQFADLVLRRKFPTTPLIYLRLLFKDAPLSVWAGEELLTSLLTPLQGTASEQQREHACLEIRAAPKT